MGLGTRLACAWSLCCRRRWETLAYVRLELSSLLPRTDLLRCVRVTEHDRIRHTTSCLPREDEVDERSSDS